MNKQNNTLNQEETEIVMV